MYLYILSDYCMVENSIYIPIDYSLDLGTSDSPNDFKLKFLLWIQMNFNVIVNLLWFTS